MRSFRPDLIVNYAISTGVSALAIARSQRIPFVMHVIDALHTLAPHKWIWPLARSFEALLLRNADATIYINEELKDYGVTLGARRQAACTVRTGVDLERFHPSRDANEIRREWSIAPDAVLLVRATLQPVGFLDDNEAHQSFRVWIRSRLRKSAATITCVPLTASVSATNPVRSSNRFS